MSKFKVGTRVRATIDKRQVKKTSEWIVAEEHPGTEGPACWLRRPSSVDPDERWLWMHDSELEPADPQTAEPPSSKMYPCSVCGMVGNKSAQRAHSCQGVFEARGKELEEANQHVEVARRRAAEWQQQAQMGPKTVVTGIDWAYGEGPCCKDARATISKLKADAEDRAQLQARTERAMATLREERNGYRTQLADADSKIGRLTRELEKLRRRGR